jgi:diguanylate cyclase (GGDEF)-like protein
MRASVDQIRLNRRLRAYTAAAMFGCGALIGVVEDFIPGGAPVSIAAGLIALAAAVAVAIGGRRLPDWACVLFGPFAVGVIAFALTFNAGPGDGAVLYMWPVLWTVFFFGRRGAIAIVACVAVAHGGVLLSLPAPAGYVNRWIDVMASTTVVAAIFELLVTRNERLVERLAGEARVDALTGALNRRGFDERAAIELAHALREQRSLAFVMLDIDYFKQVNDEWGHDTGDLVLAALARLLATLSREVDAVARIGGEEFGVLMPGANSQDADAFTERIRAALAHARPKDNLPMIRVSAGVAADEPPASIEALLQAADRGLYIAKRNGRNRTIVAANDSQVVAAASPARA